MALHHLAEADEGEPAPLVDDDVGRQHRADHGGDGELLLVQGVADKHAVLRPRVGHEARAMEGRDGVLVRDARRDHLAPAGVARHEVWLDQAGGDLQLGLEEAAVELHRGAGGREAQVDVVRVVPRVVVFDADSLQHPRVADQLLQLGAQVGAVQAGGDEDGDAGRGHAGGEQLAQDGPEQERVRHWPGDVADEDARRPLAAGLLGQGTRADGAGERGTDGTLGIRQERHGGLADDSDFETVGQLDGERASTVAQLDVHGGSGRHSTLSPPPSWPPPPDWFSSASSQEKLAASLGFPPR